MESLRWWLLMVAAVMFSMSGCASAPDWAFWREHSSHVASDDHLRHGHGHGDRSRHGSSAEPALTDADAALARDEAWWGHLVPAARPADFSGRWEGTWKGIGLFDSLRQSTAAATLVQRGSIGVAHLVLDDTIGAGVPWVMRYEGSRGVRLVYRVAGTDAWMRHRTAPAEMTAAFTLVDDKLVGTLPSSGEPVVITLTRVTK
ncbi:MAG TPA: hypothetical protein VFV05_21230 [Methylomirabilota bacterium]|nr:hypothetical protein [Methylomirabilota bacterium]